MAAGQPLQGMTGFARRTVVAGGDDLAWELKTVNGKGLEVRLRLPPGFDAEEAGFRARIAGVLTRGSVQAVLTLSRSPRPPRVRVDTALLRRLVEALAEAVPPGGAVAPASLDGLLGVRGVVEVTEAPAEVEAAALATIARALLDEVLLELRAARRGEGSALAGVLRGHLDAIAGSVAAAEAAPGRTAEAIRARLARQVEELFGAVPTLDPARLHQEALILAMRADVREELDRLALHIGSARSLLDEGGPCGRRLDFLAQELAREANTLCAKSNDAALTAIGLALRNRIEQFREQVQNLE